MIHNIIIFLIFYVIISVTICKAMATTTHAALVFTRVLLILLGLFVLVGFGME